MASTAAGVDVAPLQGGRLLGGRLGLNVPAGWWPSAATLKSVEAAGYGWVQVHAPPADVLVRPEAAVHARALRSALDVGELRVVLHAPDTLRAAADPAAFEATLEYAARAGAELVVHHGANVPTSGGWEAAVAEEEAALRRAAERAERLDLTIAVENLAPVHPGEARVPHDPLDVLALVWRVGSERVRMCFDVGHAHIVEALGALDEVAPAVALFHLHDNLGDRHGAPGPATVDPLRLDLHLPPGTGTVPWARIAPSLRDHNAPLLLEVHPPHRPEAFGLATVTAELLAGR
jgi:sugar phosphate isomerase/epimerase